MGVNTYVFLLSSFSPLCLPSLSCVSSRPNVFLVSSASSVFLISGFSSLCLPVSCVCSLSPFCLFPVSVLSLPCLPSVSCISFPFLLSVSSLWLSSVSRVPSLCLPCLLPLPFVLSLCLHLLRPYPLIMHSCPPFPLKFRRRSKFPAVLFTEPAMPKSSQLFSHSTFPHTIPVVVLGNFREKTLIWPGRCGLHFLFISRPDFVNNFPSPRAKFVSPFGKPIQAGFSKRMYGGNVRLFLLDLVKIKQKRKGVGVFLKR